MVSVSADDEDVEDDGAGAGGGGAAAGGSGSAPEIFATTAQATRPSSTSVTTARSTGRLGGAGGARTSSDVGTWPSCPDGETPVGHAQRISLSGWATTSLSATAFITRPRASRSSGVARSTR